MDRDDMARALSELDDELVEEAMTRPRQKKKWGAIGGCAAAACLALVLLALPLTQPKITATVNGAAVGRTPVPVGDGVAAFAMEPAEPAAPRVRMELYLPRMTEVSVIDGVIELYEGETCYASGPSFAGEGTIDLVWAVEDGAAGQYYTMEAGRVTLVLEYDDARQDWTIRKK